MKWPNDDDGDVLRSLQSMNFDFSKEHEIEFHIDFTAWPLPQDTINCLKREYTGCEFIDPDEEDIENGDVIGYVQFVLFEKLSYELVVNMQRDVTTTMELYGGYCESWLVQAA